MNTKTIIAAVALIALVSATILVTATEHESDAVDFTIGVGVYGGSGTVTVYDETDARILYNSSATGLHEITIPTNHAFRLTATPASGYIFDRWCDSDGSEVSSDNPIYDTAVRPWDVNTLAFFSPASGANYTVTINTWPSSGGTVSSSSVTVPSGTAYSTNGNILTIGSYTITATPASGYVFSHWSSDSGTISFNRTIRAMFTDESSYYNVRFSPSPSGAGTVSHSTLSILSGTTYTTNGNTLTIGSTTVTATPASGYHFSRWSPSSGTINSATTISAIFTTDEPFTIGVGVISTSTGTGVVSVYDITAGRTLYESAEYGVHEVTIPAGHSFRLLATPDNGSTFVDWRTEQNHTVETANPIVDNTSSSPWPVNTLAYFHADSPFTIGVGVISTSTGTGVVSVYDITAGRMLYESSAYGVHEVTIPAGHSFRLLATPDNGSTFVDWRTEQNHTVETNNPIEDDTSSSPWPVNTLAYFRGATPLTIGVGVISTSTGTGVVSVYDITADQMLYESSDFGVHEVTIPAGHTFRLLATPDSGSTFIEWRDTDNQRVETNNPIEDNTSSLWDVNTLAYFSNAGRTITFVSTPSEGGSTSINRLVVESGTQFSSNGNRITIGTTIVRANAANNYEFVGWSPSIGEVTENMTITAIFTSQLLPTDVWWANGYANNKVTVVFDFEKMDTNYAHRMHIPLIQYNKNLTDTQNGMPRYFELSGETLVIECAYNSYVKVTIGNYTTTHNPGIWQRYALIIDTDASKITFQGISSIMRNPTSDFNFLDYNPVTSTVIADWAAVTTDKAIYRIYHEDYGTGTDHVRFQANATSTFLDTYGFVMIDPTINIAEYFPSYEDIRLNMYSFALYGDSITINNMRFDMDGSQITVRYDEIITLGSKHIVASPTGSLSFTTTLTNIYITWENIHSSDPDERQCYLTFVDDKKTFEMGTFAKGDLTISGKGMWYFTTAVWSPYTAYEKSYSMDWNSPFNISPDGFILIFIAIAIITLVAMNVIWQPTFLDYVVVVGGCAISYVMLGFIW